jgi:hypothetical protein
VRLLEAFNRMEGGITRGSEEVARVLEEIQNAMDRNTAALTGLRPAEEDKEDDEEEHKDEEPPTPGTGGDLFATPTGGGGASSPRTPIDSVRASLIAGSPIEPAYDPDRAFEMAHTQVTSILHHHGDVQNAQTAEIIRKMLLRQTIRLRGLYTPHATGRNAVHLSKIPDLKADDLSVSNPNTMLRVIRFLKGTGAMPANYASISVPARAEIAEPAVHLLALLLLERGKIEDYEPAAPMPAPAPTGPAGGGRPSSAA